MWFVLCVCGVEKKRAQMNGMGSVSKLWSATKVRWDLVDWWVGGGSIGLGKGVKRGYKKGRDGYRVINYAFWMSHQGFCHGK